MDEFGTAEVGALLGAAGAVLVLIADRRSLLPPASPPSGPPKGS